MNDRSAESFSQFKDSFFYGKRTDLNFKFLSHLTESQAGHFFQELFKAVVEAVDHDRTDKLGALITAWQARGYAHQENFAYRDGPFTRLSKPLKQSRLALLTSSGHFVTGDDPKPLGIENMTQQQAVELIFKTLREKPVLSTIPKDTPADKLQVRHGGYDISAALEDPNVVFPLQILAELESSGQIGQLAPKAYSFVGACSQKRLIKEALPLWVAELQGQKCDAALLVPV